MAESANSEPTIESGTVSAVEPGIEPVVETASLEDELLEVLDQTASETA